MSGMGWVGLPDGVRYRTLYGANNKYDDDVGARVADTNTNTNTNTNTTTNIRS